MNEFAALLATMLAVLLDIPVIAVLVGIALTVRRWIWLGVAIVVLTPVAHYFVHMGSVTYGMEFPPLVMLARFLTYSIVGSIVFAIAQHRRAKRAQAPDQDGKEETKDTHSQ